MSTTRIIDAVATAKRAELVQAVEAALVDYDAAYAVFADTAEAADAALAAAVDAKAALIAYDKETHMSIEPVAYINVEQRKLEWAKVTEWHTPTVVNLEPIPLYTQQEWVGLTEDEVYRIAFTLEGEHWKKIFDAIEAKLKEKNT
jgi:hypothetical protein